MLHGFPDFWYVWRHQIPALAAAGWRVVAADMRGFNHSDRPAGLAAYDLGRLAGDVVGLIDRLGAERASVVGHDLGGLVAWTFAMRSPARLERLAIMSAPHPGQFFGPLVRPRQLARLWYVAVLQLPWLPEAGLRAGGFAPVRRLLRSGAASSETFSTEDLDRAVRAIARPGALRSALSYYRALLRRNPWRTYRELRPVEAPVQIIWGDRDRALRPELAEPDRRLVPNARVDHLPDAGHWVQLDRPEVVNALLRRHFEAGRA
jgi:pimeloyl-ACP methyl ester carboxylesterase